MTPGPSADLAGVAPPWTLDPARPEEGTLCLHLRGRWTMEGRLPAAAEVERVIVSGAPVRRLTFESGDLTGWDTGLLTLLRGVFAVAERAGIAVEPAGLPDRVRRLLRLAGAVPPRQPDRGGTAILLACPPRERHAPDGGRGVGQSSRLRG